MTPLDKNRLSEALRLKTELGDSVWPGYAALDAPVIIWNDDYEFLFRMSNPPEEWEVVPGDDFEGQPYFRRPANNPQNFAVQVGDQWAASIFIKQSKSNLSIERNSLSSRRLNNSLSSYL